MFSAPAQFVCISVLFRFSTKNVILDSRLFSGLLPQILTGTLLGHCKFLANRLFGAVTSHLTMPHPASPSFLAACLGIREPGYRLLLWAFSPWKKEWKETLCHVTSDSLHIRCTLSVSGGEAWTFLEASYAVTLLSAVHSINNAPNKSPSPQYPSQCLFAPSFLFKT